MADITTDLLPKSAKSQEARDELNAKTSALPTLKETAQNAGDALNGDRDVAGDVKKAVGDAKSALPDLPTNPAKEFANRAKSAVKSSNLPVGRPAAFDASLLQKNVSQELSQKASATAKQAGAKVQSGLSGVPSPQDLANKAKAGFAGAPSPQDLTAKIKAAADRAGDVNPAADFTSRAEKAVKSAKKGAGSFPNPAKEYANQARAAVKEATPGGNIPNPAKEFAKQAQKAKGSVQRATAGADIPNPAKEFARQAQKAKGNVRSAIEGADIPNPAKEFANQANKAKSQAQSAAKDAGINLPVSVPALYDNGALQTDVNFLGLGKKVERAADKVSGAAGEVQSKASEAGEKVKDTADQAGGRFNIFDAGGVEEAKKTLKANVEKAAAQKSDPAERVFPIGKPGETQEENAERIRIQSENANTPFGDARAPTSGA